MIGLGPSPLAWPLLIAVFVVWFRLYWHELRRNWVSWRAFIALVAMLVVWAWLMGF